MGVRFRLSNRKRIQNLHHVGSQDPEEAHLQEVHLPRCRPRPAPGHEIRELDRVARLPSTSPFQPRIKRREENFLKRLREAKKALTGEIGEKPTCIKTHLRNVVVIPEMVGSVIGVYNGKVFNQIEIKPEMINHYIGEFSMT